MKIFISTRVFYPGTKGGGPTRSLSHLLLNFNQDVKVFTSAFDLDGMALSVPNNRWVSWDKNKNIKIFYSNKRSISYCFQLFKILSEENFSVAWFNSFFDPKYTFFPQVIAKFFKVPVVISPRGELMDGAFKLKAFKKRIFLIIFRVLAFFGSNRFHYTSDVEQQEAIKYLGGHSFFTFPNFSISPITRGNLENYLAVRKQSTELVFFSRLVPKKGLENALKVLSILDEHYSLQVYGDFEDAKYGEFIHSLIEKLELSKRVFFHGFIPFEECYQTLCGYRLFIGPTKGENFGHSIYESLSIGLPVVISDQTPWLPSEGVLVSEVDDVVSYVKNIKSIENFEAYTYAVRDALCKAYEYHDALPAPETFFNKLCKTY